MRVVVTGASQPVGKRVVEALLSKGHKVTTVGGVDPKINNSTHAKWGVAQKKAHVIVHCDEKRHEKEESMNAEEITAYYQENVDLVRAVLSLNPKARFILLSSVDVHRSKHGFDANESSLSDNAAPLSVYGMSKALVEREVENSGIENFYILRPSMLYGFEQSELDKMVESLGSGRVILPGKNVKTSLLHIDSLCETIAAIVDNHEASYGFYNIADGTEVDLHATIIKTAHANGREMKIMHLPYAIALKASEAFERKAKKKSIEPESTVREVIFFGQDSVVDTTKVETLLARKLPSRIL